MFNKKNIIKNNSTTVKNLSYTKGEGELKVTLDFNLRTDIKTQLKDFLELLKVATLEVNNEINK